MYNSYNLLRLCFGEDVLLELEGDRERLPYQKLVALCTLEYINNCIHADWREEARRFLDTDPEEGQKFEKIDTWALKIVKNLPAAELAMVEGFVLPAANVSTMDLANNDREAKEEATET